MRISQKKGVALALVIMFIIVITIASLGLLASVEHVLKEVKVQEAETIRGYYAAVAGLRYARILLRDPGALTFTGGECIIPRVTDEDDDFFKDIGVDVNSGDLTITIEKLSDWKYTVKATYSK